MNNNNTNVFSSNNQKFDKNKQLISIITVVYNDQENIEKTILNVLGQKYKNIEYIIVYTPSNDETFEKIKKYKRQISKIIICKKRGIFFNMNIGANLARGDYINFMNSKLV